MKLGVPHKENNIDGGCLQTEYVRRTFRTKRDEVNKLLEQSA